MFVNTYTIVMYGNDDMIIRIIQFDVYQAAPGFRNGLNGVFNDIIEYTDDLAFIRKNKQVIDRDL